MSEYVDISLIKGEMGWGTDDTMPIHKRHYTEEKIYEKNSNDFPVAYKIRESTSPSEFITRKFREYMNSKGYGNDSADMSLLDEFAFGKRFNWFKQDTGSCFPAGTLVKMSDGSYKPIENVKVFDEVLTAEGNIKKVLCTMGREVEEPIFNLKLWGHHGIKMTKEHPVLTQRGYVEVSKLQQDDYVAMPRYCPFETKFLHTLDLVDYTPNEKRRLNKGISTGERSVGISGIETRRKIITYLTVPEVIELTKEFGWICGIFLAEGTVDTHKIVWTLHPNEKETFGKKIINFFKENFNIDCPIYTTKRRGKESSVKITLHSVAWCKLFYSMFGTGSKSKTLNPCISSANKEFMQGLVEGWLDGDGYENKSKNLTQGTTISKHLALHIHSILSSIGKLPIITRSEPKMSHGVKSRQTRYDVIMRDTNKTIGVKAEENIVWRKVQSLEQVEFNGRVYNFEVADDNSYVVEGIGVHNCVISNTFRPWVRRCIYELAIKGDPEEYFGRNEFSSKNISFYAPFSYGCGRRRGGLRGGDGSFCEVQYESFIKDGVILCNTPKLLEILKRLNADKDTDFPEPRSVAVYRRFQNWEFLDELLPYADFRLLESPKVKDMDTHLKLSREYKPSSVCSGIAIHKIGKHRDGFDIHAQNTRDSWAHNMSFQGHFEASDGKIYIRLSNESWGANVIYNIPIEEVDRWYKRRMITVQAIGEIDLPDAAFFV